VLEHVAVCDRCLEGFDMLFRGRRDRDSSAVLLEQVLEVERRRLVPVRPTAAGRTWAGPRWLLDQRGGVDPYDCVRVEHAQRSCLRFQG
jgi:hypothetical protein